MNKLSKRRQAREALLRAFYVGECRDMSVREAFHEMEDVDIEMASDDYDDDALPLESFSLALNDEQKKFALSLADTIGEHREEFNAKIRDVLINWDFERIARIDRYILWISLAEMTYFLDIPVNVSINEAIELAKSYSSDKSPKFINGILDKLAKGLE